MIKTDIQVRFNDMDPMKRVNNASYSAYLELARVKFCNHYLKMNSLNDIPFVLARVEMDLIKSVLPGVEIFVNIWVSKIGNSSWEFSYEILDSKTNELYVRAKSVQVYFNYHTNAKESIPNSFRMVLEQELQTTVL